MTDYNIFDGASVERVDPNKVASLDEAMGTSPIDLAHERAMLNNLNYASSSSPQLAETMPELVAEKLALPGMKISQFDEEFEATQNTLALETDRMVVGSLIEDEQRPWEERAEIWDRLPDDLRKALEADGLSRPTDPSPGGIDIPFTSMLRSIPGIGGDGNLELFGGKDNLATRTVDSIFGAADSAFGAVVGKPVGTAIEVFDVLDEYTRRRPLQMGQIAGEDALGREGYEQLGLGNLPGPIDELFNAQLSVTKGYVSAGLATLFSGRAGELWALTDEYNTTFRPDALNDALTTLDGDERLQVMAATFVAEGYNETSTIEKMTGLRPGDPGYGEAIVELSVLMDEAGEHPSGVQFREAIETLQNGKVGIGHQMAETLGLEQGQRGHGVAAGALDLGTAVILDPTIIAGKYNTIRKAVTWGIQSGQTAHELNRARQLAVLARSIDNPAINLSDDAVRAGVDKAAEIRNAVFIANGDTAARYTNSQWRRVFVRQSAEIEYGRSVDRLMEKIARVADDADDYTWSQFRREVPGARHMTPALSRAVREGRFATDVPGERIDKVWDFFQSDAGLRSLTAGLGRDPRVLGLPKVTKMDMARIRSKNFFTRKLDPTRKFPTDVAETLADESAALLGGRVQFGEINDARRIYTDDRSVFNKVTQSWFGVRPLAARFTRHVPRETQIYTKAGTSVMDDHHLAEGIAEFERFTDFGDLVNIGEDVKDMYRNAYISGNQAERIAVVRGFTSDVLSRAGILDDSPEAVEVLRRFGHQLDSHFGSAPGFGATDTLDDHVALWDSQLADHVAIPDYRKLKRAITKHQTLAAFGDRTYGQLDALLSTAWKPAVLMRLGFIPRAAGEETLSFVLRLGGLSYARAQFGRRWATAAKVNPATGAVENIREMSPMFGHVFSMGQRMRRWGRVSNDDLAMMATARLGNEAQGRLAKIETMLRRGDDLQGNTVAGLIKEKEQILDAAVNDLLPELPRRSRRAIEMGDAMSEWAMRNSPRFYDMVRATKLPSRQQIARAFMNTDPLAPGAGIFTLKDQGGSALDILSGQVNDRDLLAAEFLMRGNPSITRVRANITHAPYSNYGDQLRIPNHVTGPISQRRVVEEATSTRTGRPTLPKVKRRGRKWEQVDPMSMDYREGIGNAMATAMRDPSVRHSGVIDILHTHVGEDTAVKLDEIFGSENAIAKFQQVREDVLALSDDARDQLKVAITMGEDLPVGMHPMFGKINEMPNNNRIRALLMPHDNPARPLRTDLEETLTRAEAVMWHYMQLPAYQPSMASMVRMANTKGYRVVAPLSADQVRLYGITMPPRMADEAMQLLAANAPVRQRLLNRISQSMADKGHTDESAVAMLNRMLPTDSAVEASWWDEFRTMGDRFDEDLVPVSPVFFADPELTEELTRHVQDAMREAGAPVGDNVSNSVQLGMFDLPTDVARDRKLFEGIWDEGSEWDQYSMWVNRDPGVISHTTHTGDGVRWVETTDGEWIDADLLEEGTELTGRQQWADGVTEWQVRRDLAGLRMRELENLFVTPSGDTLSEALGPLSADMFEANYHMWGIPDVDLPLSAYAPEIVDSSTNWWSRMVSGYFTEMVDPAMTAVIRDPSFAHNMAAQLPAAQHYYHATVAGDLNDDVLRLLDDIGMEPELQESMLNEIHLHLKDELDESGSFIDLFMSKLNDPRATPEEGWDAFNMAYAGRPWDRIQVEYDELLARQVDAWRVKHGTMPLPAKQAEMERLAEEAVGWQMRSRSEIREQLDQLISERGYVRGQMEEAVGDELARLEGVMDDIENTIEYHDQLLTRIDEGSDGPVQLRDNARFADFESQAGVGRLNPNEFQANWAKLQQWAQVRHQKFEESSELAAIAAVNRTVPFIDDHRFRSQFQQTVSNLMPFWFAEETFIKRQLRMVYDSPESIRRASMLMNAGRQVGLIKADETGQEFFVYPSSQLINQELMRFSGLLTGMDGLHVYAQPMSSQVEFMIPGYGGEFIEGGTGPFIGFSMAMLAQSFPELAFLERPVLRNDIAVGRAPWEHLYPPQVQFLFDQFGPETLDSGRMANAELRIVQMAVANGTAPGENATALEWAQFSDQVRQQARILHVMDFMLYEGAPLPAGARIKYGEVEISREWNVLVHESGLPYAEGVAAFFAKYPEATAHSVFGSTTTTGANPDINAELYIWLDDNASFVDEFPLAGAWFTPPRNTDTDDYDRRAADELYRQGLRVRRTPEEYLREIYYQDGARGYYDYVTFIERKIWEAERLGREAEAQVMSDELDAWKDQYLAMHPVFDEMRGRNRERRAKTRKERDRLLGMDRADLPEGEHVDVILQAMSLHQRFNRDYEAMSGDASTAAEEARHNLRLDFIVTAAEFVRQNPEAEPYFTSNIRWDDAVIKGGSDLIFEAEAILGREL